MTKPTQQMFPATTTPVPLGERDTERPSVYEQAALQAAAKTAGDWRREPLFAVDPVTGHFVLALPYTATQADRHGVVFEVGCPAGTELRVPTSVAQAQFARSTLVTVVLQQRRDTVFCYAPGGIGGVPLHVDDDWRREIVQAFVDGDAGQLTRG